MPDLLDDLRRLEALLRNAWDSAIDLSWKHTDPLVLHDAIAEIERLRERVAVLESELAEAASVLQHALPIGEIKHIGLREVAAGVRALAEIAAARTEWEAEVQRKAEAAAQNLVARGLVASVDKAIAKSIIAEAFGKDKA